MNRQERIEHLQSRRHRLLDRRSERGANLASLDIELTTVRSELLILYQMKSNKSLQK